MTASVPLAVHLSKVQVWMPSAVHALAPHPGGRVVAVGREDGDIELAVPSEGYRVEARIPGQEGKGLRSLAWIGGEVGGERQGARPTQPQRLFGCGLDGTLFEVDLERLCYKNVRDAFGGAVWCMKASSPLSLLAIGCEDGSLRLFTTEGDGLEYKKSFPSTGSRILSLAWGTTYDVIFAGCADSLIHCFNASSGQSLFDMRLDTTPRRKALVWALEALYDGTLISGDSYGRVQVWDGLTGTHLQSLTTHEADVLCLCTAEDDTKVFASGSDSKVVLLERDQESDDRSDPDGGGLTGTAPAGRARQGWEWSVGGMHRQHTHDVYALATHAQSLDGEVGDGGVGAARKGPVLVSGGLDTSLSLYSVPAFKTKGARSLEPLPPIPLAFLAPAVRLLLVMHQVHVDIWRIPNRDEESAEASDGKTRAPQLKLRLQPKLDKGSHIACAALSSNGRLVALSNTRETKVYRLQSAGPAASGLSAKRLRLPGECTPGAHALAFTPDSRKLLVAAAEGDIRLVDLSGALPPATGSGAKLAHCLEELLDEAEDGGAGGLPVCGMRLSPCGRWLATRSVAGAVHVFDLQELRHHWKVPSASNQRCVGLRFHCHSQVLVCVDSSNQFRMLDVVKKRLAECGKDTTFPRVPSGKGVWGGYGDEPPLAGLAFNPGDESQSMLLFSHRYLMHVAPSQKIPSKVMAGPSNKKSKMDSGSAVDRGRDGPDASTNQSSFHVVLDFKSMILLDFLAKNELLVLENPWSSVRGSLPSIIDRKQYGV